VHRRRQGGIGAHEERALAAHLDKLEEEGRLPAGVERPDTSWLAGAGV